MNHSSRTSPIDAGKTATTNHPDQDQRRVREKMLPLWRIQGTFTLLTPLGLGTGEDEPIDDHEVIDTNGLEMFVPAVARDGAGKPYLPGSSLKGALRALASRLTVDGETIGALFGSAKFNDLADTDSVEVRADHTQPGALEVHNAYVAATLPPTSHLPDHTAVRGTAFLPHVVIDRHTGTADDGLLYREQVVPPGVAFNIEIITRGLNEATMCKLLGLLQACGDPSCGFALGGRSTKGNGQVVWQLDKVQKVENFKHLMSEKANQLWNGAKTCRLHPGALVPPTGVGLWLSGLALKFHTPFLVHQAISEENRAPGDPNGKPRMTVDGCGVLPASSLHGALRSQAERILRTLGKPTPSPHDVPAVFSLKEAAERLDEVSLLFGSTGWRGLLQVTDFVTNPNPPSLNHEMLAIDRITGGGKDGAKFCLKVLDCPTLTGGLRLDLSRWQRLAEQIPDKARRLFGLLLHTLRDLDEGDIPLGYGAARGYGQSTSRLVGDLSKWLEAQAQRIPGVPGSTQALAEWRQHFGEPEVPPEAPAILLSPNQRPVPFEIKPATGDFHNPYAFIPFGQPQTGDARLPWDTYAKVQSGKELLKGGSPHSHAAYHEQRFSGRLVCRLTPQTPWFVGAGAAEAQNANQATLLRPYEMDGKHTIPATSLRGLISSLHESVTQSRLRVMNETTYSIRTPMDTPLSAIGRLCLIRGKFWLQMLALPTLEIKSGKATIPTAYQKLLPIGRSGIAPLKTLFGDPAGDHIPAALVPVGYGPTMVHYMSKGANDTRWQMERPNAPLVIDINSGDEAHLHIKKVKDRCFLLGIRCKENQFPVLKEQRLAQPGVVGWQPGYVRLMAKPGRDLIQSRKHEVFLPAAKFPTNDINARKKADPDFDVSRIDLTAEYQLLPIPDDVIQRFCRLADEMTASQDNKPDLEAHEIRPYQPLGRARGAGNAVAYHGLKHTERALRPKNGDFVYFKPADDGNSIAEISYSSLWRQEIAATSSDWVPEPLRPLNPTTDPAKALLSPSEWLFGALQVGDGDRNHKSPKTEPTLAFSSKVCFSPATCTLLAPTEAEEAVTLKILASPKPPSPAMYVLRTGAQSAKYVSKFDLFKDPKTYQFKGRKFYIGALRNPTTGRVEPLNREGQVGGQSMPWVSAHPGESANQKVRIHPLTGGVFHFSVDFRNLSQAELESLCASLSPHHDFEHKIGMGKPLGLGSVKIEFTGLYLVDRVRRYQQTAFDNAARYQSVWSDGTDPRQLPAHLGAESAARAGSAPAPSPRDLADAHMHHLERKAPEVYRALVLSGSPKAVTLPVHYPQLIHQSIEDKTYQWFVNNDATHNAWDGHQQSLANFTGETKSLPGLSRVPRTRRER